MTAGDFTAHRWNIEETKVSHDNEVQRLLDDLGIPRIVGVERVKGIEPS